MKRIIRLTAILLTIMISLSACAPASDPAPTPETPPVTESPSAEPVPEPEPEPEEYADLPYVPTPSELREMAELEPIPVGEQLEPSTELPRGAISVDFMSMPAIAAASRQSDITIYRDVVYRTVDDRELIVHILVPDGITEGPYPLVIYIQGSAFMGNNRAMIGMGILPMMTVAEQGYAVAVVEHRGTMPANGGARFPDQVYDVKTAIRFLRQNAGEYNFDPDRFAIWGNSSGGYHAVFAGITGDELFTDGEYSDVSSEVNVIINEYGPSRLLYMSFAPSVMDHAGPMSPEGSFSGGVNLLQNPEAAEEASTTTYISDKEIPPILIMHGSADFIVPFNQSVRLYEKLREFGHETTFYKLEGDGHGTAGFNSQACRDIILAYLAEHI